MGRLTSREVALRDDVLNLAWQTIQRMMRSRDVPEEKKQEISLRLVERSIPQEKNQIVVIGGISLNDTDKIELENIRSKVLAIEQSSEPLI